MSQMKKVLRETKTLRAAYAGAVGIQEVQNWGTTI